MRTLTILLIVLVNGITFGQQVFKNKKSLLGSPFEITVVAKDSIQGNLFTDLAIAEVKRIENLIKKNSPRLCLVGKVESLKTLGFHML